MSNINLMVLEEFSSKPKGFKTYNSMNPAPKSGASKLTTMGLAGLGAGGLLYGGSKLASGLSNSMKAATALHQKKLELAGR